MAPLSHRERVLAALSHQQPDRVPIDLGTTVVTGIALKTYDRLKAHLLGAVHNIQADIPVENVVA